MKKADLKKLIKPLVKECIHEVLIEEGVLSNVVSEVAKSEPQAGTIDLGDPGSSGVDISSLMGGASQVWQQMNRK